MKVLYLIIVISLLILVACSNSTPPATIVTIEVTRIVQITTTPIPTNTLTPKPTLNEYDIARTRVANAIGTPIKANDCYKATDMQADMNNCSNKRRIELELQMNDLVSKVEERYKKIYNESNIFMQLQTEWEDLVKRECEFRSGRTVIETDGVLHYIGGSMALTGYNECMVQKYQDRLRELQIQLYELNI